MIDRTTVVAEARTWLRTPYQHQQRIKGVAVDCIGLGIGTARAIGAVAPEFDVTGYSRQPDGVSLIAQCDKYMERVPVTEAQLGDMIVTSFDIHPCHFAILGDYPYGGFSMIHALCNRDGRGRVIEHRLDASNLRRVVAAYRLPGVA